MADNLVYAKFEYYEALESKRDILSAEMSVLNVMKRMRKYHSLRIKELDKKKQLVKEVKELEMSIKKSRASLPMTEVQKKIKREEFEIKPSKIKSADNDLEYQLREIQDRLKSLGG